MRPDVVVHSFNPSTQEAEAVRSKFEASLIYITSSTLQIPGLTRLPYERLSH